MTFLLFLVSGLIHGVDAPVNNSHACGSIAIEVVLSLLGVEGELSERISECPASPLTFKDLLAQVEHYDCVAVGISSPDEPPPFRAGTAGGVISLVLPTGDKHYVAVLESRGSQMQILDFPEPPVWVMAASLKERFGWDGSILLVARNAADINRIVSLRGWSYVWHAGLALAAILFSTGLFRRSPRATQYIDGCGEREKQEWRRGFSLLELLVVLGIVGVLVSLLGPAVQSGREAARSIDCSSRLRQIGIGLHDYAGAHSGTLPPASMYMTVVPEGTVYATNMSMQAQLLPFLGQLSVWENIDRSEDGLGAGREPVTSSRNASLLSLSIPLFACPSDRVRSGGNSYRACHGTSPDYHVRLDKGARGGIARWRGGVRLSEVTDGLSSTAFFSERVVGDFDTASFTPWRDRAIVWSPIAPAGPDEGLSICSRIPANHREHYSSDGSTWLLTDWSQTLYSHVLPPNSAIPDCLHVVAARSQHPGGVHVLYGDGSVSMVTQEVSLDVWRAWASVDGGEAIDHD
jgi:prepilin-type N-terminal cleavage/methylation domain-containing protein/prepilin-type processing-associated H-X9-DG protein